MLELRSVSKTFTRGVFRKQSVKALDGVSLNLERGETLAVLGRSGCGKTTLGRVILGLERADSGIVRLQGKEINRSGKAFRPCRNRLQMVSQHPDIALDPQFKLFHSLAEAIRIHRICSRREEYDFIRTLLEHVGLHGEILNRYPHELSGGQLQRVVVARALILKPELIVLDEPTSMLDVSVQAQVINLLKRIQEELKLSYLFITHDLELAGAFSDRIVVMSEGRIVEEGKAPGLLQNPKHRITRNMIESLSMEKVRREGLSS